MVAVANTELDMENGSVAKVRCCHEEIGRVQLRPAGRGEGSRAWEDEVRGELEVLTGEHELLCPSAPPRRSERARAIPPGEHREKP